MPMSLNHSNATFTDNVSANNSNIRGLYAYQNYLTTAGTNIFDGNYGFFGGALHCISSMVAFNQ